MIAASDIEGIAHGLRTFVQWIDHDETTAFARTATIRDWPLLKLRTVVPSADHRKPLLPTGSNPANYYKIINGVSYLRFNSVLDWLPTAIYQSEEKTRELIHFASSRFTDIRPALYVQKVPGDCIEANPDEQPDGGAGIGNSDGTWESDNLCPSNPKSYQAIEDFLDTALKTHDSRYIDVGFMGCVGKNWNVCRLCRKRGLSGFELYGDFVNKVRSPSAAPATVPRYLPMESCFPTQSNAPAPARILRRHLTTSIAASRCATTTPAETKQDSEFWILDHLKALGHARRRSGRALRVGRPGVLRYRSRGCRIRGRYRRGRSVRLGMGLGARSRAAACF